jgi:ATP synthase subunit 6
MFTVFNFILICNLLSLVPFGIAITSHIVLIIFLTITFCLSIFTIGLLTHKLKFLRIFIPECPLLLLPILIPIEIFSYFIRMFSLAIRLTANIFAGHTLVYIISSFILSVTSIKGLFFLVSVIPLLMIILLEFGVAFLQAYVFTILLCIYLSDSLIFPSH